MRRRGPSVVTGAVLAMLLAGCGGDGGAVEAEPSTPASTTPAASEEPAADPGPTVEPADGAEITVGNLTLRLPKGFPPRKINDLLVTATGPTFERIAVSARSSMDDNTLAELAQISVDAGMWDGRPRRLDDVEAGGETLYHLEGPDEMGYDAEEFGAQVDGWDVEIYVAGSGSTRKRREIAEAVLASVEWGG
jgi:hypothetical protein